MLLLCSGFGVPLLMYTQLRGSFPAHSNVILTAQHSSLQDPIRARPTGCLLLFHEYLHCLSPHPSPVLAACLSTSSTSAAPSQLSVPSHFSPRLPRAGLLFLAPLLSLGRAVPLSRALAAGNKVCSCCGRASSCCHMWEYSPSLPYSWASFSHLGGIAVYTEIGNVIPPTRSF